MKLTVLAVVLLLSNCITSVEVIESIKDTPGDDLVAISAKFAGEPNRLVIFDLNDPAKYKIVYAIPWIAIKPRFSKDKSRVLFENKSFYSIGFNGVTSYFMDVYHREIDSYEYLDLRWHYPVWSYDNNKFYTGFESIYDLSRNEQNYFPTPGYRIEQFVAHTSDSQLIIYGYESEDPEKTRKLYFITTEGRYVSVVKNPLFIDNISLTQGPVTKSSAFIKLPRLTDVRWNENNRLFVFTHGWFIGQIMIADMEGDLEIEIPGGDNSANSAWGPKGETILFEREGNIMRYDLNKKTTELLIAPQSIGAVSLHSPDY